MGGDMDIPEWLLEVNPESHIDAKDILPIFGLKRSTLYFQIKNGTFPEPDKINITGRYHNRKYFWKVATIVGELERRGK
jgi:predicted DNA-binding transcriptional regulator AlpA